MRLREQINKQKEPLIIYKYHPRVLNLECSKQEITALLDDGRRLSIPTTWFTSLEQSLASKLASKLVK